MDGAGDQLLAGTSFAANEDRGISRRDHVDLLEYAPQRRASSDDPVADRIFGRCIPQEDRAIFGLHVVGTNRPDGRRLEAIAWGLDEGSHGCGCGHGTLDSRLAA
jgi:hypothetical protein